MAATWRNWSGSERAECVTVHPRGAAEIAEVMALARDDGQRVRPVGSGHSGSGIARPHDVQLALDRHADLVRLDTATGLVTVQAGMSLARLNLLLAEAGLGLTNLGDIDVQTVAGAMATGTHGTGARFGGLATQLRGLELVTPSGELITCSELERPEVFGPARIGLGALGVVSTLTLQAEPAFALRSEEHPMPLDEVLDRFDELADETDHFEFYWFPHTATALVWRRTRVPLSELDPLPAWRAWWEDDVLTNTVFGAAVALGRRVPPSVPAVNRFCTRALGARTYTDRSHRVFTATRRVRFREMEYAVPREHAVAAMTEVRNAVEASGRRLGFPMEIRVAAADDIPLSTASGRDSAYISAQSPLGVDDREWFAMVERIMAGFDGRPHWGKLHDLGADRLRELYPDFGQFLALRDQLDPEGVLSNDYLDRVLGPVPSGKA